MDGCKDHAVALYSGETAVPRMWGLNGQVEGATSAGQQYFVDVPCDAAALHLQVGDGTGAGRVYVRYGEPVSFFGPGLNRPVFDWLVSGNAPDVNFTVGNRCDGCAVCGGKQIRFAPGRWYFLPVSQLTDASGNVNSFQLGVSLQMQGGATVPARPLHVIAEAAGVNVCTWGGPATPATPAHTIAVSAPRLACPGPTGVSEIPSVCTPDAPGGCACALGDPGAGALGAIGLLAQLRDLLFGVLELVDLGHRGGHASRPTGRPRTAGRADPAPAGLSPAARSRTPAPRPGAA
jgi:hypothetical protein